MDDEAVEEFFVEGAGGGEKFRELELDALGVGVFGVGHDIDIGVILEDFEEAIEVEGVVFAIPERGHEIIISIIRISWGSWSIGGRVGLEDGAFAPAISSMGEHDVAVIGDV